MLRGWSVYEVAWLDRHAAVRQIVKNEAFSPLSEAMKIAPRHLRRNRTDVSTFITKQHVQPIVYIVITLTIQ